MRPLASAPRFLTPLAVVAAALAVVAPSATLAAHSDLLLALLVLATALGISGSQLAGLRRHGAALAILSIVPLIVLAAVAWLIGRPFDHSTRDGLLAVGLSSSEVAAVGLVALAGEQATIALGAVTGSLVLAALIGPAAIGALSAAGGHAGAGNLLGRFALVVLLPLAAGIALRSADRSRRALERVDGEREGVAALAVAALVYAALSGARGAHGLGSALIASVAFLAISVGLGELWRRRMAPGPTAVPGAFAIAMRDFAVAAALATQAFGSRAGAVPGVYGVVMLLAGSAAAGRLGRDARRGGSGAKPPGGSDAGPLAAEPGR
jgi:BASS family bile acid:Na+ symporter